MKKFQKKFYLLPKQFKIKEWLEAMDLCKKIVKAQLDINIQTNIVYNLTGNLLEDWIMLLSSVAYKKFNELGENLPNFKIDEIPKKRYEPRFYSQKMTVQEELPSKLEKFNIYQETIEIILSSEDKFNLNWEYKNLSKRCAETWWSRMKINNCKIRRHTETTTSSMFFPCFDLGIWVDSMTIPAERRMFEFDKEYKFIPVQDIDEENILDNRQPKDNWKYIARIIRMKSLMEMADKHVCCDHKSYRRIMEALFMILAHREKIIYIGAGHD
jgi:hypothetical protein